MSNGSKVIKPKKFDPSQFATDLRVDQPVMLFEHESESPAPVDCSITPADFIPDGRRYSNMKPTK